MLLINTKTNDPEELRQSIVKVMEAYQELASNYMVLHNELINIMAQVEVIRQEKIHYKNSNAELIQEIKRLYQERGLDKPVPNDDLPVQDASEEGSSISDDIPEVVEYISDYVATCKLGELSDRVKEQITLDKIDLAQSPDDLAVTTAVVTKKKKVVRNKKNNLDKKQ